MQSAGLSASTPSLGEWEGHIERPRTTSDANAYCCWMLWNRMNNVILQGVGGELPQTFAACMSEVALWGLN